MNPVAVGLGAGAKRRLRVAGIVSQDVRAQIDFIQRVLLVEGWLHAFAARQQETPAVAPAPGRP